MTAVDVNERAVALAAARLARRAADLVAGAQLAAAHLRGGDIDVAIGLSEAAEAQEAVALAGHLEDAANLIGCRRIAALVALLGTAGAKLDRRLVGVVEHRRGDDELVGVGLVGLRLVVGALGGRASRARAARRPTAPAAVAARSPRLRAGRSSAVSLGDSRCVRTAGALERFDQLVAAHAPVAVDPGCGRALVEVGQVHLTQF